MATTQMVIQMQGTETPIATAVVTSEAHTQVWCWNKVDKIIVYSDAYICRKECQRQVLENCTNIMVLVLLVYALC